MDETSVRMVLEGRVQGVGFRAWTRRRAGRLRLRGWVRNRADGRVEIHAAGPASAVEELREMVERGPRMARVEGVSVREPGEDLPDSGFQIRS